MGATAYIQGILRWIHVIMGILWIGHLYFFNFTNSGFAPTMDADTKKKVVPELMARALYWFRVGAIWTWVTGLLLLLMVYYHSRSASTEFSGATYGFLALTILAVLIYEPLAMSPIGKDLKKFGPVGFVLIAGLAALYTFAGKFPYPSMLIHFGAMFGTIMASNVVFRIWPAQQKIVAAVKAGTPPDPALVALAGIRSRTNTYLSLPLLFSMMGMHMTAVVFGNDPVTLIATWLAVVVIGWTGVFFFYKRAGKIKGW